MVKPAQDGVRTYETGSLNRPRIRRSFVWRPMCSDAIVVASVRFENSAQMCPAQNNDVIQTPIRSAVRQSRSAPRKYRKPASNIDEPARTARETLYSLSHMRRLSRQAAVFSILSILTTVFLLLGPCSARFVSSQFSIIVLFPLLYAIAILASALLWRRRGRLGLSNANVVRISTEIILCPVLLVNIAKRISLARESETNTFRLASLCRVPDQTLTAINENLKS
jgi:hypothetical protein